MFQCRFSSMCIICTGVSVISVSVIVGLWTFQFLSFSEQTRSRTPRSDGRRLAECSHPIPYNVTLRPRLKPNIWMGSSSVMFECVKETDLILIHSNELKLTAEVTLSTLARCPAPSVGPVRSTRPLVLHLSEKLKAGERYTLHTRIRGKVHEHLRGFHKSGYTQTVEQLAESALIRPPHTHTMILCCDERD